MSLIAFVLIIFGFWLNAVAMAALHISLDINSAEKAMLVLEKRMMRRNILRIFAIYSPWVIPPFLTEVISRVYAACNICCLGVYPPSAILGLS